MASDEVPVDVGNKVKPMLTTAQKTFREVLHPGSILSGLDHSGVVREDLEVPDSRCFLLHGILTPAECTHYITETEKIGYSDLSDVFPANYRSNDRVLSICQPLVDELWKRIEQSLTRKEVIRVRPVGFGNEGTWKPFRLNECCKFGRYKAGGYFSPHIDGPWVPHENESSVFTVVIYLNSDFQGGTTKFILEETPDTVLCSVTPRTGTALIFNHDTLHEAEPVYSGTKYIIRTEIMYRRVDSEMLPDPGAYESDGNYIKTLTLYQKSWELEKAGDVEAFTDTYLEAISLQRQAQRSISMESTGGDMLTLPYELFLKVFSYLSANDVCTAMRVCKSWYDVCMDGELWHELYHSKWPVGFLLEGKIDAEESSLKICDERPFLRDWYGLYKQRVGMAQPQKVAVLDMGSFSFKCAAVHRQRSTVKTSICESVVAAVEGIYDVHHRVHEHQRYYSGREAKDKFPGQIQPIAEKGIITQRHILPEIVTRLFIDCVVRPKYTPVIILEPPGLWSHEVKMELCYTFIMQYQNPGVAFLSSAVAILCSLNLSTGVAVDVGEGVATCAAVVNGKQRKYVNCDPSKATPTKLAQMVHTVVTETSIEDCSAKATLLQNIVLTGGMCVSVDVLQADLLAINRQYCVRKTDDPVYSAVLGGCNIANVIDFPSMFNSVRVMVDCNSFPEEPSEFFKPFEGIFKPPYREVYYYKDYSVDWFGYLNAGRPDYRKNLIRIRKYENLKQWKQSISDEGLLISDTSGSSEESDYEFED